MKAWNKVTHGNHRYFVEPEGRSSTCDTELTTYRNKTAALDQPASLLANLGTNRFGPRLFVSNANDIKTISEKIGVFFSHSA